MSLHRHHSFANLWNMADRSVGGGLLDYDEEVLHRSPSRKDDEDEDRMMVHSHDPLNVASGAANQLPAAKAPPAGVVDSPGSIVSAPVTGCVPSSIQAPPSSSFLREQRVTLLGEKTKALASALLPGRYLATAEREAFAKIHKLISDPLSRSPDLDETVREYAKMLHVDLDLRFDGILRDVARRTSDAWHPLLALHEVAERHLDNDQQLEPQTVMNFVAYVANYLAAATQKIAFYRRHAVISALDAAVKKQSPTGTGTKVGFRQAPFRKGAMSSGTRSLLEKTPTDAAAFVTTTDGSQIPQLFGGSLVDQLVSKSEDTTKTQKGFDHLFAARYGSAAVRGAKRPQSSNPSYEAKRGRFSGNSFSASRGHFASSSQFRSGNPIAALCTKPISVADATGGGLPSSVGTSSVARPHRATWPIRRSKFGLASHLTSI